MNITTIAVPSGLTDPNITDTSPIWVDADNNEYFVTSGYLDGEYTQSEPMEVTTTSITVAINMDGLKALNAMGLKPKDVQPNF